MIQKKPVKRQLAKVQDYKNVFTTDSGKKVLHDMMSTHGMLMSSYDKDPSLMAFREGERNVVLRIMSLLKTDVKKLKEYIERADNEYGSNNDEY